MSIQHGFAWACPNGHQSDAFTLVDGKIPPCVVCGSAAPLLEATLTPAKVRAAIQGGDTTGWRLCIDEDRVMAAAHPDGRSWHAEEDQGIAIRGDAHTERLRKMHDPSLRRRS